MLFVCDFAMTKAELDKVYSRARTFVKSEQPTRLLIIGPTPDSKTVAYRGCLEVAKIRRGFPFVHSISGQSDTFLADQSVSMFLVLNRESMLIDPIDWPIFKQELVGWANVYCLSLVISTITDELFNERTPLSHFPRAQLKRDSERSGIYHFFDPERKPQNEVNHLLSCGIPLESAKLINKVNCHDRGLSLIGILPNQLRSLLKQTQQDADVAFEAISKELFWKGYAIWKIRKRLMSKFWKEIAPENWKLHTKKKKEKKTLERAKNECTNPFHFLVKHSDLAHRMPTPCPCSRWSQKKPFHKFVDLRDVFKPLPLNRRKTTSGITESSAQWYYWLAVLQNSC